MKDGYARERRTRQTLQVRKIEYREVDFEFDIRHFAVSHKLTGAVFRFDGYPDPVAGTKVRVSFPDDIDDSELEAMCSVAGQHLKARIDRTRS
jgi:hypothetical protein